MVNMAILQQYIANIKFLECHPVDISFNWKHCNIVIIQSHTCSSEQDQLLKKLKPLSPHVNKTSTWPLLVQSSKGPPHTLNHTTPSPLFPQTGLWDTWAWSFSIWYSQSNPHKQDSHITRSKISLSLIETQPLPSTPAYGHEFDALAFHLHPTFAAPLVVSAFKIRSDDCVEFFAKTVTALGLLAIYAGELCPWCSATLS